MSKIAIVTDRGEQVVYVSADCTAERRVVEVGFEDDDNTEIVSGIESGERVLSVHDGARIPPSQIVLDIAARESRPTE